MMIFYKLLFLFLAPLPVCGENEFDANYDKCFDTTIDKCHDLEYKNEFDFEPPTRYCIEANGKCLPSCYFWKEEDAEAIALCKKYSSHCQLTNNDFAKSKCGPKCELFKQKEECIGADGAEMCHWLKGSCVTISNTCLKYQMSTVECSKIPICQAIPNEEQCNTYPDRACAIYKGNEICTGYCIWDTKSSMCTTTSLLCHLRGNRCQIDYTCFDIDRKCLHISNGNVELKAKFLYHHHSTGRCFQKENKYKPLNATIEAPKEDTYACFANFHNKALQPLCGHTSFNQHRYCSIAAFYDNKDYDKFDKTTKMLLLLDGCLFCSIGNMKDVKITIQNIVAEKFETDMDPRGNFMLSAIFNHDSSSKTIQILFRHRCNPQKLLQYKVLNITMAGVDAYPSRVWESRNTAISLEQGEKFQVIQNFTELVGKQDL